MNLGKYPPDLHGHFDWLTIPSKEDIVKLSIDLKTKQKALKDVKAKLQEK